MEAGSNSFEIARRLMDLGVRAVVLESYHASKHAKTYADNDKMTAARIALVYLAGNASCVWQSDAKTCERRELLDAYEKAVSDDTSASNTLKSYLNQFAIRLRELDLKQETTKAWIIKQRNWTMLQKERLTDYFKNLSKWGSATMVAKIRQQDFAHRSWIPTC